MSKITKQEVEAVQKAWGKGIVEIGKAYINGEDYKQVATDHINEFYNYQEGTVLFKPTLASVKQFRLDFEGALSYFIGENSNYPEDKGFALKPWLNVGWESAGIKILGNGTTAIAMGNYYFTPKGENSTPEKVEYSFVYIKVKDKLRIELHHSSLPYAPE